MIVVVLEKTTENVAREIQQLLIDNGLLCRLACADAAPLFGSLLIALGQRNDCKPIVEDGYFLRCTFTSNFASRFYMMR